MSSTFIVAIQEWISRRAESSRAMQNLINNELDEFLVLSNGAALRLLNHWKRNLWKLVENCNFIGISISLSNTYRSEFGSRHNRWRWFSGSGRSVDDPYGGAVASSLKPPPSACFSSSHELSSRRTAFRPLCSPSQQ